MVPMRSYIHPVLVDLAFHGERFGTVDDPDALVRESKRYRMDGLLWTAVQAGHLDLPIRSERELGRSSLTARAWHDRIWSTLSDLYEAISSRGFEVAVFKGVTAEHRWYSRVGERPCADIDLWLAPYQRHQLGEVLGVVDPKHPLRDSLIEHRVAEIVHTVTARYDGIEIDIHTDPLGFAPDRPYMIDWWSRNEDVAGIMATAPEVELVIRLFHCFKDERDSLLYQADCHRILSARPEADWIPLAVDAGLTQWIRASANAFGLDGLNETESVLPRLLFTFDDGRVAPRTPLNERSWLVIPLTVPGYRWTAARRLMRRAFPPRAVALYQLNTLEEEMGGTSRSVRRLILRTLGKRQH